MLRGAAAARGRASEVDEIILKLCGEAPNVRPVCLKSLTSCADRLVNVPLRDGRTQRKTVHQPGPSAPCSAAMVQGITQKSIQECEPDLQLEEIMASINSLVRQHRLEMLHDTAGVLVVRAVSAAEATK